MTYWCIILVNMVGILLLGIVCCLLVLDIGNYIRKLCNPEERERMRYLKELKKSYKDYGRR